MTKHVSVQPDVAIGDCPECGLPYYHVLNHIGGSVTYIHSDVDVLTSGIEVEYCYAEKLPTSATIDASATIELYSGLPQRCTLFFHEERARADLFQSRVAFTRDHPDWEEGQEPEFYDRLLDTGDFDSEAYLLDVEIKKKDLPYHGMALYLASTLYDVMLWVLKEQGLEDIREPKVPKVTAYTAALKVLGKAYEEFKGYGLRNVEGSDG